MVNKTETKNTRGGTVAVANHPGMVELMAPNAEGVMVSILAPKNLDEQGVKLAMDVAAFYRDRLSLDEDAYDKAAASLKESRKHVSGGIYILSQSAVKAANGDTVLASGYWSGIITHGEQVVMATIPADKDGKKPNRETVFGKTWVNGCTTVKKALERGADLLAVNPAGTFNDKTKEKREKDEAVYANMADIEASNTAARNGQQGAGIRFGKVTAKLGTVLADLSALVGELSDGGQDEIAAELFDVVTNARERMQEEVAAAKTRKAGGRVAAAG